jgi:dimethylargininase
MTSTEPLAHHALVRPPATTLEDGVVIFLESPTIDFALAQKQWALYVAALEANGWPTVVVPRDDSLPDSVFIEDSVVMFGTLAVITNPEAAARNPEIHAVAATVTELGFDIERITAPATLDGGDVLKIGTTVYVGLTSSTNRAGVDQLASFIEPRGFTVVPVPVTKAMHLKSAVTALPDGTVIGYAPLVDDPTVFPAFIAVPENTGAAVVLLGDTLLMSAAAPKTTELLRSLGYTVTTVDISEFEKLEGCVTCLSVRLR